MGIVAPQATTDLEDSNDEKKEVRILIMKRRNDANDMGALFD